MLHKSGEGRKQTVYLFSEGGKDLFRIGNCLHSGGMLSRGRRQLLFFLLQANVQRFQLSLMRRRLLIELLLQRIPLCFCCLTGSGFAFHANASSRAVCALADAA